MSLKILGKGKTLKKKNSRRHFAHPCEKFAGYAKPFSNSKHPANLSATLQPLHSVTPCLCSGSTLYSHPSPSHLTPPPLSHLTPPFEHGLHAHFSISLKRYHFHPLFSIALDTLRAMLILVGGRELRKKLLLIMLG